MALWGDQEVTGSNTGTIQIFANGLVTGVGTDFVNELSQGYYIRANSKEYNVISITNSTSLMVGSGSGSNTITAVAAGNTFTVSSKPTFASFSDTSLDAYNVVFVDLDETEISSNVPKGFDKSGWVKVLNYTDAKGNDRWKTEILVPMKRTAAYAGDPADDPYVSNGAEPRSIASSFIQIPYIEILPIPMGDFFTNSANNFSANGLPSGLTISSSNGDITGVPTMESNTTVTVTASSNATNEQTLTFDFVFYDVKTKADHFYDMTSNSNMLLNSNSEILQITDLVGNNHLTPYRANLALFTSDGMETLIGQEVCYTNNEFPQVAGSSQPFTMLFHSFLANGTNERTIPISFVEDEVLSNSYHRVDFDFVNTETDNLLRSQAGAVFNNKVDVVPPTSEDLSYMFHTDGTYGIYYLNGLPLVYDKTTGFSANVATTFIANTFAIGSHQTNAVDSDMDGTFHGAALQTSNGAVSDPTLETGSEILSYFSGKSANTFVPLPTILWLEFGNSVRAGTSPTEAANSVALTYNQGFAVLDLEANTTAYLANTGSNTNTLYSTISHYPSDDPSTANGNLIGWHFSNGYKSIGSGSNSFARASPAVHTMGWISENYNVFFVGANAARSASCLTAQTAVEVYPSPNIDFWEKLSDVANNDVTDGTDYANTATNNGQESLYDLALPKFQEVIKVAKGSPRVDKKQLLTVVAIGGLGPQEGQQGVVTAEKYKSVLEQTISNLKDDLNVDLIVLDRTSSNTTSANAAIWDELRTVEEEVANADFQVILGCPGPTQYGVSLTVNADDQWTAGIEFADNVHPTGEYHRAQGRYDGELIMDWWKKYRAGYFA